MSDTKIFSLGDNGMGGGMAPLIASLCQNRGLDPNMVAAMMNNNRGNGWGDGGAWATVKTRSATTTVWMNAAATVATACARMTATMTMTEWASVIPASVGRNGLPIWANAGRAPATPGVTCADN